MSHTMFPRTAVEAVARDKKQKVIFDNMSLDYLLLTRYLLKVSRQQILNYVNTTFYLSSTYIKRQKNHISFRYSEKATKI